MSHLVRTALAVGLCLAMPAAWAARPKPTGFDPARANALAALPIRVVVLNDGLRSQWAYASYSISGDFASQAVINNAVNNMIAGGASPGAAIGAGAIGGALAGAIIDANMRAQAQRQVERADALLDERKCRLDLAPAFSTAVDRAVAATGWGAGRTPRHDLLAERQELDKLLADTPERQQVTITYSMTPDYANLVSTLTVATYAVGLKPERARKDDPAWIDELVIASDPVPLADKTPADVEAAIKAEDERHLATGIVELVRAANAGDSTARRKAVELTERHRRYLRDAKATQWTPGEATMQRASRWVADDCAALRAAGEQQAREAEVLLTRLFRGELPTRSEVAARVPPPLDGTDRVVEARGGGMYLMGRGGTIPMLGYRYSWLPLARK